MRCPFSNEARPNLILRSYPEGIGLGNSPPKGGTVLVPPERSELKKINLTSCVINLENLYLCRSRRHNDPSD